MLQILTAMEPDMRLDFLRDMEAKAIREGDSPIGLEVLSFKAMQASLPEAFRLPMPPTPTKEPEPGK